MVFSKRFLLAGLFFLFCTQPVFAAYSFVVRHIEIQGLHRIQKSTVLSYLPMHVGERFHTDRADALIQSLYKTGFFTDVTLLRQGNTLIVRVQERPIIGLLTIKGNKAISTKKLKKALKNLDIVEGQPYFSDKLNAIKQGLQYEYDRMGYHAAVIDAQVVPESENRVALNIKIHEGTVLKVREIRIIGNKAFSRHRLLENFQLTTPGLLTLITHHDRFSKFQLDEDVRSLQMFYLNHGYLRFRVLAKKVTYLPEAAGVIITIHISEGPIYYVSGYDVKGKFAKDAPVHKYVSTLKIGAPFSRQTIISIEKKISNYFANHGYAFPAIRVIPKVNDQNHTVYFTFYISHGHRVYVRRINFSGNNRTENSVLRSELRQLEASAFSLGSIQESKRRLSNLPYLRNVQVTPVPVLGHPDLVDLNYNMQEVSAGKASIQGGYSDIDGILYGASISEPNFMGTGKYVNLGFTHSSLSAQYSFTYNNPFYTINGVSLGFNIYYNRTTATKRFNIDTYTMNDLGGSMFYGIPLSNYDTIHLGYGYDHVDIRNVNGINSSTPASPIVLDFIQRNESPFSQFNLTGGWSHVSLDRAIFPTHGNSQGISLTVGVPLIRRSVGYYKITYDGTWYYPIGHGFILNPHTKLGFGDGIGKNITLPFYNNFYAGGITTLPGFEPNSLGPKNPNNSNAAIGGNVEVLGGINLILPQLFSNKLRTALFLDFGNIFETEQLLYTPAQIAANPKLQQISYESLSLRNLRVTTGVVISWYLPFLGPVDISLGTPIVKKKGDRTAVFGFTFGATI